MPDSFRKDVLLPVVVMTLVCVVVTLLLATVNAVTRDRIAELAVQADTAFKQTILPDATVFADRDVSAGHPDVSSVVEGSDASGASVGHVVTAVSRGYAGPVSVMVGVAPDGTILDVLVVEDDETPGLGKKVHEDYFLSAFDQKDATAVFSVKPDDFNLTRIDAVAGATISSRAVADAVNKACAAYLALQGGAN